MARKPPPEEIETRRRYSKKKGQENLHQGFLLVIAERLRLKGLKEVVRARRLSRDLLVLIKFFMPQSI
ncbi:unnamed protein product [Callosobruchus maculatus]|uniref:Uncharacterized protein n=1 Tax=Callosobruchus maculatus TaxID=64391 RepID=A0A653D363_CALMS|nr:unnamed protein product [Callosobruchus maculatus]